MIALKPLKRRDTKSLNSESSTDSSSRTSTSSDLGDESDRHALLTAWQRAENTSRYLDDLESKWPWRDGPVTWSSQRKKFGILLVIIFALAFCLWILWWKIFSVQGQNSVIYRPSLQGDYFLDPNWNFSSKPTRREYRWTIRDQEHNPDGVYRSMMLINSQFPGPMIDCTEGDTIVVHVDNQAANATTFHWHGIYQNGTNWMDGTVGITQCPIAPGTKFTYEFEIVGQWGTYW